MNNINIYPPKKIQVFWCKNNTKEKNHQLLCYSNLILIVEKKYTWSRLPPQARRLDSYNSALTPIS